MVLRGHGGVKLNIFKRLHVPLAVLSVDGGDVRVHAVRQGLAVIYFYGLEHLLARDELHSEGAERIGKRFVFQQRFIRDRLRLSGSACAVKPGQRVGDEEIIRERTCAAAADRARILGIPGDGHKRHAAGDGAAAAGHAVRHTRAGDAADITSAGKRTLGPAVFNRRAANARDAADIIAALALHAAVGLAAVDQAEIHPAADRRRAVLLGCDCARGDAALQNGAQLLLALGRGQALVDIALGVSAGPSMPIAPAMPPTLRSACTAPVFFAAAQSAHGDAVGICLRAVGHKGRGFPDCPWRQKTVVLISSSLSLIGLHVFFAASRTDSPPVSRWAHLRAHAAQRTCQLRHGGIRVHLQRRAERPEPSVPPEIEMSETGQRIRPTPAPTPASVAFNFQRVRIDADAAVRSRTNETGADAGDASPTVRSAAPLTPPVCSARPASMVASREVIGRVTRLSRYAPIPASWEPRSLAAPPGRRRSPDR